MNNKLQILDYVQILAGFVLGMSTKILSTLSKGDIKTIFEVVNVCGLLLFVQGIMHILEDKYEIKLIDFKSIKTKPVMYANRKEVLR